MATNALSATVQWLQECVCIADEQPLNDFQTISSSVIKWQRRYQLPSLHGVTEELNGIRVKLVRAFCLMLLSSQTDCVFMGMQTTCIKYCISFMYSNSSMHVCNIYALCICRSNSSMCAIYTCCVSVVQTAACVQYIRAVYLSFKQQHVCNIYVLCI